MDVLTQCCQKVNVNSVYTKLNIWWYTVHLVILYDHMHVYVCGPQASYNMNTVLPGDKTKYLVVHKIFSDYIGPYACVCGPEASHNRNTVLPVDKT